MNENNFFSNTNPELVNSNLINELNNIVIEQNIKKITTLGESSVNLYKKYVQPNLIPIIVVLLFVVFMIYRYMTKKNEKFDPTKHPSDSTQTKLELSETNNHTLDNVINSYIKDKENEELEGSINEEELMEEFYKPINSGQEDYFGTQNLYIDGNLNVVDHPYNYDSDFLKMENSMADFSIGKNKYGIDEVASKIFN